MNQERYMHTLLCENSSEQIWWILIWEDNTRWSFSLNEALLWTCILARSNSFKLKTFVMVDLFLTNTQLFTLQDVNWWTGVMWIIVMFLSAVWTLILTAPIHFISPHLFWRRNHLHVGWPVSDYIVIRFSLLWTVPLMIPQILLLVAND